jgi:hypothetical protein
MTVRPKSAKKPKFAPLPPLPSTNDTTVTDIQRIAQLKRAQVLLDQLDEPEPVERAKSKHIADAVQVQPTTVVTTAEVEDALTAFLAATRGGPAIRSREAYDNIKDLIYDLHQACEEWIESMEEANL